MGNIISNIKAQSQEIYKTAKGLMLEDNLIEKSLDGAINKVGSKNQSEYVKMLKSLKNTRDAKGVLQASMDKATGLKKTPKEVSILGNSLTDDQLSRFGQAVSNDLGFASTGGGFTNIDKSYEELLKKTKGSIGRNVPGSMASAYYINPFKDGLNAINDTKFKDNTRLHQGMARIGATSAGIAGVAAGAVAISSSMNDEDLKDINARLKTQYDEGRL